MFACSIPLQGPLYCLHRRCSTLTQGCSTFPSTGRSLPHWAHESHTKGKIGQQFSMPGQNQEGLGFCVASCPLVPAARQPKRSVVGVSETNSGILCDAVLLLNSCSTAWQSQRNGVFIMPTPFSAARDAAHTCSARMSPAASLYPMHIVASPPHAPCPWLTSSCCALLSKR